MVESDLIHNSPYNPASRFGGWDWRPARRDETFRTCSFCGSMHPADLAEMLGPVNGPCVTCGERGWRKCCDGQHDPAARHSYDPGYVYASWADMKYGWPHKFYVEGLKPAEGLLHCIGHYHGGTGPGGTGVDPGARWVAAADLTREEKKIVRADGMGPGTRKEGFSGWYMLGRRSSVFGKFYTEHLRDPAIGEDVKDKIMSASGIWIRWEGQGVAWAGSKEALNAEAN